MKEPLRLVISTGVAVMLHVSFLFNAGHSAATVPSNQTASVMRFDLTSLTQAEPSITKPEQKVKSLPKPSPALNKIKQEQQTETKNIPVEKVINAATALTETAVKQPINIENVVKTTVAEIAAKPTASVRTQPKESNISSVVREKDGILLQQPQFKSLPPPPVYPRRARSRGQQGTALVHARLNTSGDVIKTRLAKSSGFSLLDKAAIKAVKSWDFMQGVDAIGNAQVWVEIPVQFILNPRKVS